VDADDLLLGDRRKPERVGVAKIGLLGEGEPLEALPVTHQVEIKTIVLLAIEGAPASKAVKHPCDRVERRR